MTVRNTDGMTHLFKYKVRSVFLASSLVFSVVFTPQLLRAVGVLFSPMVSG